MCREIPTGTGVVLIVRKLCSPVGKNIPTGSVTGTITTHITTSGPTNSPTSSSTSSPTSQALPVVILRYSRGVIPVLCLKDVRKYS